MVLLSDEGSEVKKAGVGQKPKQPGLTKGGGKGNGAGGGWKGNSGKGDAKGKAGKAKKGVFGLLGALLGKALMGDGGDDWSGFDDLLGGGSGGTGSGWSDNYKGDLATAYRRSLRGKSGEEEKIVYETEAVEGKHGKFQTSVTVAGKTIKGDAATGKRNAEQMAAKAALEKLFPDYTFGGSTQGAQKRSWKDAQAPMPANKDVLISKVCLLLGRPATKEDIVWKVENDPSAEGKAKAPRHIGSVTLTERGTTFTGEPQWSFREAENDAARVAIEALYDEIIPLEEEKKAKKAKKNQEALAKMKEKQAEKKAQKATAAA